ncbi:hypothetical protein [Deinococcus pimensis]|uniref:hypothetical protein n=1 Tax=Deinococcus pimensis TaxID=309888 RepID=UPI0004813D6F|nr:hypothetical protein [Deinococcus pimensis]
MNGKTIHLIHLPMPAEADAALTEDLPAAGVTHVDITDGGIELVLPDASREEAVRLARTISARHPTLTVRAHLRVNARWLPRALTTGLLLIGTRAHVVEVDVPARIVTRTFETRHPRFADAGVPVHVQAAGTASQLVLPAAFEVSALAQVTEWVKTNLSAPRVLPNSPGRWVPNGSRHHDVERFVSGVDVSSGEARLWTDDA